MDLHALTPDRLDDLAELFGTTVVTTKCHCTWFYVGFESTFRACGFTEAGPRPGKRLLMRRTIGPAAYE